MRDILLGYRPPETPAIVARNVGREGEDVRTIHLSELEPSLVDMLTLVIVGNRETRRAGHWVYTPRGYGRHLRPEREAM